MNMQTAVITCFKKFITIKGRASRSEFWWFALFSIIMSYGLKLFIDVGIFGFEFQSLSPSSVMWSIITFFPWICLYARRLHDINLSGWWQLYYCLFGLVSVILFLLLIYNVAVTQTVLIFIGIILLACAISPIYFLSKKGTAGDNRFGADPLAEENPH